MPIQVITTYKRIPPSPVTLKSAGDDIFPICDVTIFLTAIVDNIPNLNQGHTILWEQLSGTPVTLINPDQQVASYLQIPLDETDKEFRVTIDKFFPEEQSSTVTVYATPTSIATTKFWVDSKNFTPATPVDFNTINVTTSAQIPEPLGVRNNNVTPIEIFKIFWDIPPDIILQPFLTQMTLFENDIPVATYLPTDLLEYLGGPNVYNVSSDYIVNGQPSTANSRKKDFFGTVVPKTKAIDDIFDGIAFTSDTILTIFTNNIQSQESIMPTSSLPPNDTNVVRFINNSRQLDQSPVYSSFTTGSSTIFRSDPGGIGGG